ncbi:uncharacterized protein LACBIDRAFT_332002 [Laccaria bicolor S238N-H82]|uniref:Predicted protein n=1 Tax=Laccaria bicolor (strain S238N-H82 / ATCC MYA-4686) TaxID=486041 RepID=B0DR90_LACBS|nr:uncharacterized protein LACBIDRAFT_332002 [Laccaria bicolor S238N-H82]EDR02831.1 predicted protein [Laccaria bicolor S238N-H82]|eukprot:XP_001886541.1 predicted protein [Laccaria bicolor S238N-H82]
MTYHSDLILTPFQVDDLPEDITALCDPFQESYSCAEQQAVQSLTISHKENLSLIGSQINGLDLQIAPLQSRREKLLSKQDQELKNIEVLKSILSPIRRVLVDLLWEIFLLCLPTTPTDVKKITYDAPLLLCQVCSKWRRTALAFPPLWKSLDLKAAFHREIAYIPKTVLSVHPSIPHILDSWFARAGRCPLSLGFDLVYSYDHKRLISSLEGVLKELPNSHLQRLSLKIEYPCDAYFLAVISREFTELESISLKVSKGLDARAIPRRLFQSAPRLCSADLRGFIRPTGVENLLPWSQLTHLRVETEFDVDTWYYLISHCTNLQHGIFSMNNRLASIPTVDYEINLPHLIDLTLHITSGAARVPNVHRLNFPTLRRLQWLFDERSLNYVEEGYIPATCNGSLENLAIAGNMAFTESQLISLLNSSFSITKLHFSVAINYTNFFEALTSSSFTHQLLPKLKILHCDIRSIEDVDAFLESLISFLRSRCYDGLNSQTNWTTARLRRLTLTFPDNVDTDNKGFKDRIKVFPWFWIIVLNAITVQVCAR